jgi:hypothetical protein
MTKTCNRCQQAKPVTEFCTRKNRQGVPYPRTSCRVCWNASLREIADRREKATARQRNNRAEMGISGEITALIQATTTRSQTKPPPIATAADLAAWHQSGCPIAPHQRRQAVA